MKKIKFIIFLLIGFLVLPAFAERRTRIDRYGKATTKIIWNSDYTIGPDNTNWANHRGGDDWTSITTYHYLLAPGHRATDAIVRFYKGDSASYYGNDAYHIEVNEAIDGLVETVSSTSYYSFQYNQASLDFNNWVELFEKMIY